MDHRRPDQLGYRAVRIPAAGAGQPHRLHRTLGRPTIMQEVITLAVFVPFSVYFMQQPLKLDYLWAGLCLLGAVYFIFRA
ncbi:DMT family protein [Pseudomonas aeruginosa]